MALRFAWQRPQDDALLRALKQNENIDEDEEITKKNQMEGMELSMK